MATAEYDREADALYVRLAHLPVARTVAVDDYRVVDLAEDGSAVGIEVLYPSANLAISNVAIEFGFADRLTEIDAAVSQALGFQPAERVTVSITFVSPEKATASVTAGFPVQSRESSSASALVLR